MKYCIHCGTGLDENARFCCNCGAAVGGADEEKPVETVIEEADIKAEAAEAVNESAAEAETAAEAEETVEASVQDEEVPEVQEDAAESCCGDEIDVDKTGCSEPKMENAVAPVAGFASVPVSTNETRTESSEPVVSEAAAPRSPGKALAGFILGIVSLVNGCIGAVCAFCALIPYASVACMLCAISCGCVAVGSGIPGLILAIKARRVEPDNKRAKLGRIFSMVGIIAGGFAIIFGIIFGVIGIMYLFSYVVDVYRY